MMPEGVDIGLPEAREFEVLVQCRLLIAKFQGIREGSNGFFPVVLNVSNH